MSEKITLLYHKPSSGPAFPLRQTYDMTYDDNKRPQIKPASGLSCWTGYSKTFKEFGWAGASYTNKWKSLNGEFIFRPAPHIECALSCAYKNKKIRAFKGDIILYRPAVSKRNCAFSENTFFKVGGTSYTDAHAYKNVSTGGYYGASVKIAFLLSDKKFKSTLEYTKKWRLATPDEVYAFYNIFKKPFSIKEFEKRKSEITSLVETNTTEIEGVPRVEIINAKKDPDFLDDLLQAKLNKKHKSFIYFK